MTAARAWLAFIAVLVATSGAAEDMAEKRGSGVSLEHGPDLAMCAPDGIAIGGYDVLSYRSDGGPRQGDPEFAADHEGKRYLFVSADNRDRFLAEPARYVPAYDGFCAITLSFGRVTCPEYTNFKIEDGRLLLFEVTGFTNGRTLWNSDAVSFRQRADANYERLLELR